MEKRLLQSSRGFTLMELLVVIAIIGVLVGVSVPALGTVVDNARRDHDIACVEAAVAAAQAEFAYDYDGEAGSIRVYAFDASSGEASAADPASGYGQWSQEADYSVDGVAVSGVAEGSFVSCIVIDGEVTRLCWGSLGPGALYERAELLYGDKTVALTADTARERLLTDVDAIRAMAADYLGLTKDEIIAKARQQPAYQARLWNDEGVGLFTYRNQNGTNPQVRGNTELLTELGFLGPVGATASNSFSTSSVRAFFSDFMNSGVEANIVIGKIEYDADGKAVKIKAWVTVTTYNGVDIQIPTELTSIYATYG